MMQTLKRSLSMFMVLVMLVAFVPALSLGASAAEVDYKYNGSYIYNWGNIATFSYDLVRQKASNFTSAYEKIANAAETKLEETLNIYENLE